MIDQLIKVDLFELLQRANSKQKFYFEAKNNLTTILALGPTEKIAFDEAPSFLKKNPNALIWSAMNFENTNASPFFSSYLTLIKKGGKTSAIINPRIEGNLPEIFSQIESTPKEDFSCHNTVLSPDFSGWKNMIQKALQLLESNKLVKIVLKRNKIITMDRTLNPLAVFTKAYANNSESYKIYYQKSATEAFISFTPEKLFSLTGLSDIETLSLAGSTPRGKTLEEEQIYEASLLNSSKLIHEQNIVTEEIHNRLNSIAKNVMVAPLSIMKLQYIQHRANIITGKLLAHKNFIDLITTLHPTPAVGGTPQEEALDAINILENEKRFHYAAPIGFATNDYAEYAVGLRSAMINSNNVTIFSGCGIVAGSDPQTEWDETEVKMSPFTNLFSSGNI